MTARTLAPHQGSDLPSVSVLIDGAELGPRWPPLSVVVERTLNRVGVATLRFVDGDESTAQFPLSDLDLLAPGAKVEIKAGYHQQDERFVFRGILVRHGLQSRAGRGSVLEVICKAEAVRLTQTRRSRSFHDVTDTDVMNEMAEGAGLSADIAATKGTHHQLVQYQCTDWDWILSRAEHLGLVVEVDGKDLRIFPPDGSQAPGLSLVYGATILELELELDAEGQPAAASTSTWSPADQATVEAEGADPGLPLPGKTAADLPSVLGADPPLLHHGGSLLEEEISAWAGALLLKSRLGAVRGRVRCQGTAKPTPGQVVELKGVGARFSGKSFVSAVRHEISAQNWVTDLQIGLDRQWHHQRFGVDMAAAGGLVPRVPGLHVGVVTALEGDPDGELRVRVRLPLVADEDGSWARLATLDAGKDRGTVFRPEIGDEVVVGFFHEDPRGPVILGMLHSSAMPAPIEASDANPQKGYKSRSGISWTIDDELVKLSIETPGKRIFTLDDDAGEIRLEGDGHSLVLNADGVTIKSGGDIVLSASGDIKMDGTNIELAANSSLSADGGSGAELTSSATTTVKGSLVQIN